VHSGLLTGQIEDRPKQDKLSRLAQPREHPQRPRLSEPECTEAPRVTPGSATGTAGDQAAAAIPGDSESLCVLFRGVRALPWHSGELFRPSAPKPGSLRMKGIPLDSELLGSLPLGARTGGTAEPGGANYTNTLFMSRRGLQRWSKGVGFCSGAQSGQATCAARCRRCRTRATVARPRSCRGARFSTAPAGRPAGFRRSRSPVRRSTRSDTSGTRRTRVFPTFPPEVGGP